MENLPEKYTDAMEQARREKWNVLTPAVSMEGLSEFHKPVVEVVRLSPNKDDGDVYPASNSGGDDDGKKGGKVRLSGKGIEKLGMAACVMWNLDHSRRTDDHTDPDYVSWQAVGGIRKPDGTIVWMKAEYDLDLRVLEEEMAEQAKARHRKTNIEWIKKKRVDDYVKECIARDLPQKRKHKLKLAETGARNRVIRALLGLKNEYAKDELAKPFVLARIVLQPDYNDPAVKQAVLAAYLQSTMGIYGGTVATQAQAPIDIPKSDYHTMDPEAPPNGGEPDSRAVDFENADSDAQIQILEHLIKQKGYDYDGEFKRAGKAILPLSNLKPKSRVKLFESLSALADAAPNQPDDIPN